MYAALKDNKIIAMHDEMDIVKQFIEYEKDKEIELVKIKHKKHKKIKNIPEYYDLYLVRFGDRYIPHDVYRSLENINNENIYDYKHCIEVLFRILEEENNTDEQVECIRKTISVVTKLLHKTPEVNTNTLEMIKKLDNEYRERMFLNG